MLDQLSPKDLAAIIGVSESSLKRWVDDGRLNATKTLGGHRRIALHEAVRFIRDTNSPIRHPEMLGMPELTTDEVRAVSSGSAESELLTALQRGEAERARGLIIAQFLAARSIAAVCDGPIAFAMHRIGEMWRHQNDGILIEHRATEICTQAIHQARLLMPPPPGESPVAVGGAIEGDASVLPTLMSAACVRETGLREINLGANTPIQTFMDALVAHHPLIVWVAVSGHIAWETVLKGLERLAARSSEIGASLVLGGQGVSPSATSRLPATFVVSSMSELVAFVKGARLGSPVRDMGRAVAAKKVAAR